MLRSFRVTTFRTSAGVRCINVSTLFSKLVAGDRGSLAKAITLEGAQELLDLSLEHSRQKKKGSNVWGASASFRIGLSGAPGVGKSSFIESFGTFLVDKGHKVAVLVWKPYLTGGSILGDKTRMSVLSRMDNAYIRPSPSGVARNTNDVIVLCEAAGYDVVLVETVGVGQSELIWFDMFVLLVAPGAGDEATGIVELSDIILVNKSDGVLEGPARIAQMEYISALKFCSKYIKKLDSTILRISSSEKIGLDDAWESMTRYYQTLQDNNELEEKRGIQRQKWVWNILRESEGVREAIPKIEADVRKGVVTSGQGAETLLSIFKSHYH
ncbi:ArgK protein-domain-containing protein [Chytridium lagenaria]|nr:ArgK protein-domain-containing protein [Chytridium lagenaria]